MFLHPCVENPKFKGKPFHIAYFFLHIFPIVLLYLQRELGNCSLVLQWLHLEVHWSLSDRYKNCTTTGSQNATVLSHSMYSMYMCILSTQLSCYDQSKQLVLASGYLADNILTHFLASVIAVYDSPLSLYSIYIYSIITFSKIRHLLLCFCTGGLCHDPVPTT